MNAISAQLIPKILSGQRVTENPLTQAALILAGIISNDLSNPAIQAAIVSVQRMALSSENPEVWIATLLADLAVSGSEDTALDDDEILDQLEAIISGATADQVFTINGFGVPTLQTGLTNNDPINSIDRRIAGLTGTDAQKILLSTINPNVSYVRSATCWAADLDTTPIAVWCGEGGAVLGDSDGRKRAIAISPRHVVMADHYRPPDGTTFDWVTKGNLKVTRTMVNSALISGSDIRIGVLDSDLPDTISFCRILPNDYTGFSLAGFPVVVMDAEWKVLVKDLVASNPAIVAFVPSPEPTRLLFNETLAGGDSSSPIALVVGNELVLLGATSNPDGAPSLAGNRAAIDAAMTTLGGGYTTTAVVPRNTLWKHSPLWEDIRDKPESVVINVTEFGAVDGGASDSTKIQAAIDYVKTTLGGGTVRFPAISAATVYNTDAPIIVHAGVSILVDSGVKVKKTTATASVIAAAAGDPNYIAAPIGNPICVFHLVERIAGVSYVYSNAKFICNGTIEGDTSDPNTTAVTYGIFTHGMSQCEVDFTGCIQNTKYGFVQYGDAIISSHVHGRIDRVLGGFYVHFATMMNLSGLFVSRFRDFGHFYNSFLYSHIDNVVSEYGAIRSLFPTTTVDGLPAVPFSIGGAVAFVINSCVGSTFKLGSELHIGSGILQRNNRGCSVESHFLVLSSDYTGSRRIAANYLLDNFDHRSVGNRFEFAVPALTGAAVATEHWNYLVDTFFGRFEMADNRYIDLSSIVVEVAESGEGWDYVSGDNGEGLAFPASAFTVTRPLTVFNGDVGIGTATPGAKLGVYGLETAAVASSGTVTNAITRVLSDHGITLDIGMLSGAPYATYLQNTDRSNLALEYPLSLNPNGGNVGVGTASPAATLDVAGPGRFLATDSTLAGLGAAGTVGRRAFITDGNTTLTLGIGTTAVGGGANKVPVYDDGTNWIVG